MAYCINCNEHIECEYCEKKDEEIRRLREAGAWLANHILQYRVTTPEYQDARLLVVEYDRRRAAQKEGG